MAAGQALGGNGIAAFSADEFLEAYALFAFVLPC